MLAKASLLAIASLLAKASLLAQLRLLRRPLSSSRKERVAGDATGGGSFGVAEAPPAPALDTRSTISWTRASMALAVSLGEKGSAIRWGMVPRSFSCRSSKDAPMVLSATSRTADAPGFCSSSVWRRLASVWRAAA